MTVADKYLNDLTHRARGEDPREVAYSLANDLRNFNIKEVVDEPILFLSRWLAMVEYLDAASPHDSLPLQKDLWESLLALEVVCHRTQELNRHGPRDASHFPDLDATFQHAIPVLVESLLMLLHMFREDHGEPFHD